MSTARLILVEPIGRLGARLILQQALEDEVTEFLGRARYESPGRPPRGRRRQRPPGARRGTGRSRRRAQDPRGPCGDGRALPRSRRTRVELGAELAQRPQQLAADIRPAEVGGLNDDKLTTADGLGDIGQRRDLKYPRPGAHLVRQARHPVAPRVEDVRRPLPRPGQHAGIKLWHGVHLQLQRGHNAEVPAAAAQRPEELGLVLVVGAHELPVRGDELGRAHAVAGQAVLASEPAVATAERVADDPDLGRGAGQSSEPRGRGQRAHVAPLRGRADADAAVLEVDLGPGHPPRLEEERVPAESGQRARAVPFGLHGHAQAVVASEVDDRGDLVCVVGSRHHGGYLIDGEVPGGACGIPALLARLDNVYPVQHSGSPRSASASAGVRRPTLVSLARPHESKIGPPTAAREPAPDTPRVMDPWHRPVGKRLRPASRTSVP